MQPLLTQDEVAELCKLSVRTLERLRTTSGGPKYLKIRSSVRFRPADVEAWLASRLRGSTSEWLDLPAIERMPRSMVQDLRSN